MEGGRWKDISPPNSDPRKGEGALNWVFCNGKKSGEQQMAGTDTRLVLLFIVVALTMAVFGPRPELVLFVAIGLLPFVAWRAYVGKEKSGSRNNP